MKLAFSTLGCPNWSWDEIFATAKDMGIAGIEIRGIGKEMYAPHIGIFDEEHRAATLERLSKAGLTITQLTSGASLGIPSERDNAVREVTEYIDMASKLGVDFIRVMISPHPGPEPVDIAAARELYRDLCGEAKKKKVCLLIETNGMLSDSKVMAEFMEGADPAASGVLWDIHHPYRFCGERPEVTLGNIGRYVKYIHVKDSVLKNGTVEYRMMGYGDVPILDALAALKGAGYDGFISLEWVKRWNQELQEPGIVFYHYNSYMKHLLSQL